MQEEEIMKDFFNNLEQLFRYFFSGMIFIFYITFFYPDSKMANFIVSPPFVGLANLCVILFTALTTGIIIYIINRYIVAATFDYIYFVFGCGSFSSAPKSFRNRINPCRYHKELISFVLQRFEIKKFSSNLSNHLLLRHAHMYLLLFLCELSLGGWLFGRKVYWWVWILFFIFLIWQDVIIALIERTVVQKKNSGATP